MRIAVIGTGHVGGALGAGWARAGHEVIFGTRELDAPELKSLLQSAPKASADSVLSSAARAEVTALAVPWSAVSAVLAEIGEQVRGKILIDCTNPATAWPALDHSAGSGAEQIARLVPDARTVKAFNTTGFENMQNPKYGEGAVTMFYAGDDLGAKKVVHGLAKDLGFDPVDAGGLTQAHALEILASLWGTLAYGQKMGRGIAFRLMRR
ncbi:MAG TPA: NADPH-dependent F420 reductase [Candidatus Acidoferrales bacterium]|nr:NADPH-dependent F420 reductase [Candidatus Acidoferrales bacterium]